MKKTQENIIQKHIVQITLTAMLLAVISVTTYFACSKSGLFCDEVYSYGLSNSVNYTFLGPASSYNYNESGWVDTQYFADYLICRTNERTSYKQVWANQKQDTLPPFYYMLLHFACSLFPDTYSKAFGLGLNFFFWFISLALLYRLSVKTLAPKYALFPCVLWGSTAACISMVTYIRMYTMVTCILLAFVNVLMDIILQEHKIRKKQILFLLLLMTAGTLTHYYFLVIVTFLAIIYLSYLLYTRRRTQLLTYLAVAGASAGISLLIFPDMINHLFYSDRGTQAMSNFKSESGSGFSNSFHWMNQLFFGGFFPIFIVLSLLFWGIFLYKHIKKQEKNSAQLFLWIIFWASVLYIILIMKIAPFSDASEGNRYMYPIYPLLALTIAMFMNYIPDKIKIKLPAMCILSIWIGLYTITNGGVQYRYPETEECILLAQEDKNKDCIFIYDKDWFSDIYHDIFCLMQYDELYFLERNDLDYLPEILDRRSTKQDGLIVAFWDILSDEEVKQYSQQIMNIMGYETCEYRYTYQSNVYRFY